MFRTLAAILLVSSAASGEIPASTRKLLEYDAAAPLNLTEKVLEDASSVRLSDIQYDSPRGGRVTGYLIEPRAAGRSAGRSPGIVFGHWGPGDRTEFIPEAIRYAQAGAVCVLIDYPWTRPNPWRRPVYVPKTTAEEDRDTLAQAVVDLRRAFDLLLARRDVDPKRIAYVGHSFGAQFGAILTAVDRRMATSILMAGTPTMAAIWLESDNSSELREIAGIETLKKVLAVTGVLDGIRFVPDAAPIPVLMQFAKYERSFSVAHMQAYADATTGPKRVLWYPTGHELNDPQALVDRAQWLQEKIGLAAKRR